MEIQIASLGRAALFLGVPFVLLVFYLQWRWAGTCDRNIQVLVAQLGGGGRYFLAPKDGGQVTIKNPQTDDIRTWPINELATIDITYPGVGFVPKFLQKTIRLAIVNEGDWEPMLNRSPHRKKIASPDVVAFIKEITEDLPEKGKKEVAAFLHDISTGPTREMIADPSILGGLLRTSVMKALATVSDDLTEALKKVTAQLGRIKGANATVVYIGLGLVVILLGFVLVKVVPALEQISNVAIQVNAISQSLGIGIIVPPTP